MLADPATTIEDTAPSKGIILGSLIGAMLWGAAILTLWLIIEGTS
jgi:hypothetical protein